MYGCVNGTHTVISDQKTWLHISKEGCTEHEVKTMCEEVEVGANSHTALNSFCKRAAGSICDLFLEGCENSPDKDNVSPWSVSEQVPSRSFLNMLRRSKKDIGTVFFQRACTACLCDR